MTDQSDLIDGVAYVYALWKERQTPLSAVIGFLSVLLGVFLVKSNGAHGCLINQRCAPSLVRSVSKFQPSELAWLENWRPAIITPYQKGVSQNRIWDKTVFRVPDSIYAGKGLARKSFISIIAIECKFHFVLLVYGLGLSPYCRQSRCPLRSSRFLSRRLRHLAVSIASGPNLTFDSSGVPLYWYNQIIHDSVYKSSGC